MSASHRRNRTPKGNRPKSHNEIRKRRGNLRRPGTAPMRITQTQTFYAYENVGDEKNDDSGFIESDEDEDASFYNYDISPSVISNRNGSTSDQQDQQLVVENNYMTNLPTRIMKMKKNVHRLKRYHTPSRTSGRNYSARA